MMGIKSQTLSRFDLFGVLNILMDQGIPQYSVMFNWKDGSYTVSWPDPKQVNQEDEE